jgi:hypothetical protein
MLFLLGALSMLLVEVALAGLLAVLLWSGARRAAEGLELAAAAPPPRPAEPPDMIYTTAHDLDRIARVLQTLPRIKES